MHEINTTHPFSIFPAVLDAVTLADRGPDDDEDRDDAYDGGDDDGDDYDFLIRSERTPGAWGMVNCDRY